MCCAVKVRACAAPQQILFFYEDSLYLVTFNQGKMMTAAERRQRGTTAVTGFKATVKQAEGIPSSFQVDMREE